MKILTVFTPSFNRAYCLHQVYESLKMQTNKNFKWLIIDDGSTDHTRSLVNQWKEENIVEIKYIWQDNQGMHGAHNTAYENIDTELNVCIDSDDFMPVDAVEKILAFWQVYGSDKVSGIIGLDADHSGRVIGTKLPLKIHQSSLYDIYHKFKVKGDKKLVYRTELTKKFPYPLFTGEKYVGLAYKYFKLDQEYKMLLLNEVLCIVEYLPDGSSLNIYKQYKNNPNGFAFYRKELMKLSYAGISFKFRQAVHYVSSSLFSKNHRFLQQSPSKFLTVLASPAGFILYHFIRSKNRAV
ncbi:glycosyltransferase family 2 protein [Bacillus sp. FJAT-42376]|uniref:glycosyltransferase family 2 protein n=1 Tax=Bacillus sp. FJAT-42376 TaxID=2014076 RepID=UPI000F4EEDA2|nr:glycosyltransferase family 2 protein [Bacillus sp. FJAT-42376]AZB43591.1 glycosyltransferase family 2 protein [Bacillus sp. FJAT-42376]